MQYLDRTKNMVGKKFKHGNDCEIFTVESQDATTIYGHGDSGFRFEDPIEYVDGLPGHYILVETKADILCSKLAMQSTAKTGSTKALA